MLHLNCSINLLLEDVAVFKEFPKEWTSMARAGVEEEMKNRREEVSNNMNSLGDYRDKMLIEILRLHNKT